LELLDEFFDLGDASLENQITFVRFAFGDLVGDGSQHQILDLLQVGGLAQRQVIY